VCLMGLSADEIAESSPIPGAGKSEDAYKELAGSSAQWSMPQRALSDLLSEPPPGWPWA
jgi:hypothetical protein